MAGTPTMAGTTHCDRAIDARSIVTLVVFFVVNALVLFPIRIRVPAVVGRWGRVARQVVLGPTDDGEGVLDGDGDREAGAVGSGRGSGSGSGSGRSASGSVDEPRTARRADAGGHGHGHALSDQTIPTTTENLAAVRIDTTITTTATEIAGAPRMPSASLSSSPSTASPSSNPTTTPPTPASSSTAVTQPSSGRKPPVFTLGLATAPVAGVLLLLASTCIPGSVVRKGIVGEGHVRPYDVMTLFLSFAYISLSLDCTGLLLYLAMTVSMRSPPNGKSLFTYLYALFIVLALAVGNDPIVLSGTPFVAYFTSHARIDPPTAFLFAEFQGANLASALLVSSNPTNLVLTSSFHMSFLSFSAWTALPTVAAAAALYPTLMLIFRSHIPATISPPHVIPRKALTDPQGAVFTTTIFILSIVLLVALSASGHLEGVQGVWSVTAPAALLVLARDCYRDWSQRGKANGSGNAIRVDESIELSPISRKSHDVEADRDGDGGGAVRRNDTADGRDEDELNGKFTSVFDDGDDDNDGPAYLATGVERHSGANAEARCRTHSTVVARRPAVMRRHGSIDSRRLNIPPPLSPVPAGAQDGMETPVSAATTITPTPKSPTPPMPSTHQPHYAHRPRTSTSRHPLATLRRTVPTVSTIISRLPLPLLPFAFSMFILVEALDYTGWISVWALWWERWARASGAAGCIVLMGIVSVVGCNILGTNIGATVLLSRVLSVWAAEIGPSKRALYGSMLALAVGSNFGAYSFSFPASLAGLLWRDILAQKGLHVRAVEFVRWNMLPLLVTMVVGGCVVGAEVCVMFKPGEK